MHRHRKPLFLAISMTLASVSSLPAKAADAAAGPAATELDRIEVRPQLESQLRAVELKRDAQAILDAVSSDALGDYPDKNVAESLQRLPGISVTRDQGEGRYVVIRGLDAALNSVSVDGIAMGTPEDASRSAPLDVIPSDSTERLKVIKSPTPDMPGDAIGGAIQVESASAFDRDGRSLRGSLEASRQQLSGKTSPKAAFNYSDIFNDSFGVALGVNHQDREFESDNTEVEYGEYDEDRPDDLFATEVQRRKYHIERKRTGANLNLDWRPDADSRYYFRSLYSKFEDAETRQNTVFGLGDGEVSANGDGSYTVADLPADAITKRLRYRTKREDTFAASLGGENRLTAATLDYRLGYTKTRERVNDEMEARFEYAGDDIDSVRVDQNPRLPTLDFSDAGWESNDDFEFDRFAISPKQVDDEERSAQMNVRFDAGSASYKFGVLGRWRERGVNSDERELRRGPDIDLAPWTVPAPAHRGGTLGQSLSSAVMRRYWAEQGGQYSERPQDAAANAVTRLAEDYQANEDVLAAYAMGSWDIQSLRVIAGVRVENTDFSASGNQVDVDEDGEGYSVAPSRVASSYTRVLPGLHLRYDAGDRVLRFAATRTLSRPSFGDIAPRLTINREDEEVDVGNPGLKPYMSTNLDLSFEQYLGETGIVSLGLFHKSIDDYIVQTVSNDDPQYPGFDVTRAINGDQAKVYGAEFNWQQTLSFLPAGWDGLLVGLSATWLDTDFDPGLDARADDDFTLPRASKQLYSAHLGYEQDGFSARVAAVYRSKYLDTIGDSSAYDIYVAPNTQLDFSMNYRITPAVSLYFEAQNLLDEPLELYQGVRSRTLQNEEYGRSYALGIKVAL